MAPMLSTLIFVGLIWGTPISARMRRKYTASSAPVDAAMISDSVEDMLMQGCFLLEWPMHAPQNMCTVPVVPLIVSQSLSV